MRGWTSPSNAPMPFAFWGYLQPIIDPTQIPNKFPPERLSDELLEGQSRCLGTGRPGPECRGLPGRAKNVVC